MEFWEPPSKRVLGESFALDRTHNTLASDPSAQAGRYKLSFYNHVYSTYPLAEAFCTRY